MSGTPKQGPTGDAAERGTTALAALAETWKSLAAACDGLTAREWSLPTGCPGWSVQDQLAHLIGIERSLLGQDAPTWDDPLGDHVRTPLAESNEPWIAVRRSRPGPDVLAEFVAVTELRLSTLRGLAENAWDHVAPTFIGEVALADFVVTRVFDSWVHEQDVRVAVGRPGGTGGLASALAVGQVASAMGFVVGKKAAAPEGWVVRFSVTGPARDARQITLVVQAGRARPLAEAPTEVPIPAVPAVPAVILALSSLDFVRLGCGRVTAAEVEAAGGVEVAGDAALGERILQDMNFMF